MADDDEFQWPAPFQAGERQEQRYEQQPDEGGEEQPEDDEEDEYFDEDDVKDALMAYKRNYRDPRRLLAQAKTGPLLLPRRGINPSFAVPIVENLDISGRTARIPTRVVSSA